MSHAVWLILNDFCWYRHNNGSDTHWSYWNSSPAWQLLVNLHTNYLYYCLQFTQFLKGWLTWLQPWLSWKRTAKNLCFPKGHLNSFVNVNISQCSTKLISKLKNDDFSIELFDFVCQVDAQFRSILNLFALWKYLNCVKNAQRHFHSRPFFRSSGRKS